MASGPVAIARVAGAAVALPGAFRLSSFRICEAGPSTRRHVSTSTSTQCAGPRFAPARVRLPSIVTATRILPVVSPISVKDESRFSVLRRIQPLGLGIRYNSSVSRPPPTEPPDRKDPSLRRASNQTSSPSTSPSSTVTASVPAQSETPTPGSASQPPSPSTSISTPPPSSASTPAKTREVPDTASILRLLSLAKPQWPLLTAGVACLVVSTGVNLGIPWAIGRIIDFFAPGSEATALFGMPLEHATVALALILLVGAIANSGRSICLRLAGQRTVVRIR